jgi:hypothetical protein
VAAGRYGSRLHFCNLSERRVEQTLELGETGMVPLEVRWLHDPVAVTHKRSHTTAVVSVATPR